jgi:CubicO group peptidase (beta-lactamase class C family)
MNLEIMKLTLGITLAMFLPGAVVAQERETGDDTPPYTWDTLAERLQGEARDGFSGSVLVVHHGKIVHSAGYGEANRDAHVANGPETIFAIGSVGIDFTRAAILRLEQDGKLSTGDPITRFIDDVPADKRGITLDHLMTGRSGLPDFFHIPGTDADPDLSWIDRDTAVQRMMSQQLLFEPGTKREQSHAAFGLLAVVVEIASGQSYGDYLSEAFFEPAGMTRTGLHEDATDIADREFAIGYDAQSAGKINAPKYWGRTSWLVMGSGGVQSTTTDMYRWLTAIREHRTLSAAAAEKYWTGHALAGGDDRGFFCIYTEGPDHLFVLCSNAHTGEGDRPTAVARRLYDLVQAASRPAYTLGVQLEPDTDGITVRGVVPGGAAARGGMMAGDVIVTAGGRAMNEETTPKLMDLLRSGDPIAFTVRRDGRELSLTVRPDPRS